MLWMGDEGSENGEKHEEVVFAPVWFAIVIVAQTNAGRGDRVENQAAVEHPDVPGKGTNPMRWRMLFLKFDLSQRQTSQQVP